MRKFYILKFRNILSAGVLAMLFTNTLSAQQSYTFTPCGATGSVGPTQTMINNTYQGGNLQGSVTTTTAGIQNFTIPVSGPYRIEARGGQGYGQYGGRGAIMIGDFTLTAGTVLKILVGQTAGAPIGSTNQYGGGGGSFITYTTNTPLVVAGGGGGSWAGSFQANSDGTVVTAGNPGLNGAGGNGNGGTNGDGGYDASYADGGGGLMTNGGGGAPGLSFLNGGTGGANRGHGGFGGGGGTSSWDNYRGGGAGGYSGGGASAGNTTAGNPQGGGGGSYNNGINQNNTSGANYGDGKVIITELCPLNLASSGSNSLQPVICSGTTLTLTTNGVSNYSWSTGNTTSNSVIVTPTVTTTYSVISTTSINCTTAAFITVTVSPGLPTLTINTTTTNICLGDSVKITASGALSYTWTNGITNGVKFKPNVTTTYTVSGKNGCGITTAMVTVSVSPLQLAVSAVTNVVCASNTTTLTAGGASTYTWTVFNQTLTGTSIVVAPALQTVYTVTGSISGCIGTSSIQINTKPNPTLNISGTGTIVCAGGTVGISVTGAITYTWLQSGFGGASSITVSPTGPTNYQVSGSNSLGCVSSANYIVIAKPSPTLVVTSNPVVVCSGGNSTLTVTGAHAYNWSGGATTNVIVVNPTQNTVYNVAGTFTDTGCSSASSVSVAVFLPQLAIISSPSICPGGVVTLTTSTASNHQWNTGSTTPFLIVSPLVTTLYTVTANVTGTNNLTCPASNSVYVTVYPTPVLTVTASRTNICRNEKITLTVGGASTYMWMFNNTTAVTTTFVSNVANTFTNNVIGTDANGCMDTSGIVIKVLACTGIETNGADASINIYPNPGNGNITVEGAAGIEFTVTNQLGQVVRTFLTKTNRNEIDLTNLASGVYYVSFDSSNGRIEKKIVIQN